MSDREIYMQEALRLAEEAAACGDVPVAGTGGKKTETPLPMPRSRPFARHVLRAAAGVWMTAHCL